MEADVAREFDLVWREGIGGLRSDLTELSQKTSADMATVSTNLNNEVSGMGSRVNGLMKWVVSTFVLILVTVIGGLVAAIVELR